jgi:uncharacterized protein
MRTAEPFLITSIRTTATSGIYDPLYGALEMSEALADLVRTAAVQRLRRVRLSNIDSVASPGIAGVSRFEHVLGTSHLAQTVAFWRQLEESDQVCLAAAALLHDIAITPYGHLLEEALHYAGISYSHEHKMAVLFGEDEPQEPGGIDFQLYHGFESGISPWARKAFGQEASERLRTILDAITGGGRFGPCISGQIDVDNIDNVIRLAHHMGIESRPGLAPQLAQSMIAVDETGLVWDSKVPSLISAWLSVRARLYSHLMFARSDFIGKAMLTTAIVEAYSNGQLGQAGYEWTMTDDKLLQCLRPARFGEVTDSKTANQIAETVRAWEVGQLWSAAPFWWVDGDMPRQAHIWEFRLSCSTALGRKCFPHGIADKRHRALAIRLEDGRLIKTGKHSDKWLLGVVSPRREDFTRKESSLVMQAASDYFGRELTPLSADPIADQANPSFFDY